MLMCRGFIYGCLFGIAMASGRAKKFRYMFLGMGLGAGYAFQESQ